MLHLCERACCLIKHGAAPALVELADATTHVMATPALAYVVLWWGRGCIDGRIARVTVRDVDAHTAYAQSATRYALTLIPLTP